MSLYISYGCGSKECYLNKKDSTLDSPCTCLKNIPHIQKEKIIACLSNLEKELEETKQKLLNKTLLTLDGSEPGF